MATLTGKDGSCSFDASITSAVLSWSITATGDVVENTYMLATDGYKTYLPGYIEWTAEVEVEYDNGGLDPSLTDLVDNDGATLILYQGLISTSKRKYTGTGIITNVSANVSNDGTETLSYSFQGSSSLTEATHV